VAWGSSTTAHDETLDRDVAIKILPEVVAFNPERMARFEREAKLLASLNHPNIASIYGLEQHEKISFLVMEFVEVEPDADGFPGAARYPSRSTSPPPSSTHTARV
jgi:serine/threonine protein kinase